MADKHRIALLHGTLDLIVLRALATMGPLHAYALASRLEQVSEHPLMLNQGTLYPALVRLTISPVRSTRTWCCFRTVSRHVVCRPRPRGAPRGWPLET
jgi:hypothetical protein